MWYEEPRSRVEIALGAGQFIGRLFWEYSATIESLSCNGYKGKNRFKVQGFLRTTSKTLALDKPPRYMRAEMGCTLPIFLHFDKVAKGFWGDSCTFVRNFLLDWVAEYALF